MSIITLSSALPSIIPQVEKLKSKNLTILYSAGDNLPVELYAEFSKHDINVSYLNIPKNEKSSIYAIIGYLVATVTEDSVFISDSSSQDYIDVINTLYETFPSIKYKLTIASSSSLPALRQKSARKETYIKKDRKKTIKNESPLIDQMKIMEDMIASPTVSPTTKEVSTTSPEAIKPSETKKNAYKKVSMQEAESTDRPALRSRVKKIKTPEFNKSFSEFCAYNGINSISKNFGANIDDVTNAISSAATASSEPIGFQIQLQIRMANKDLSDAIYKKIAPEYKNLKKSLEITAEESKRVVQK